MSTRKPQSTSAKIIKFHDVQDPIYGMLSPLSPHPVIIRHRQYPSLHHYFLCERFKDFSIEQRIQRATTTWELDRLVKEAEAKGHQRAQWNRIKLDVMLLGTYFKFKQNEEPRKILLGTEQGVLVDHTVKDDFWGDNGNGTGKNLMGVTLMVVRDRLRREESHQSAVNASKESAKKSGLRALRDVMTSRQLAR
ncbi:unnamed protein product [Phytomonas sp. Hart1]|nr:unnamed protein product [Phytomonas sp. Hart1]|eukprot:CCW71246.1 unnamed protein product [Phytomonas sp. isolate Hart1]